MKKLLVYVFVLTLLLFGCGGEKPPYGVGIESGTGYFTFQGNISSIHFPEALQYFSSHSIKKVVIEIHSLGCSLFEVWRIVSLMELYSDNIKYETRVYGIAASGGLVIFIAWDKRLVSKRASFMWHNLPGHMSKEDNKFFDDGVNRYIAIRSGVPLEQIEGKIREDGNQKDWYFGAKEAISLGIAHGYIE